MGTITLWHGAHRWDGPPTLQPAGKMKSENGSGLYLTTSAQTAQKYAKEDLVARKTMNARREVLRADIEEDA